MARLRDQSRTPVTVHQPYLNTFLTREGSFAYVIKIGA
jgi:hypothetical protein